MDTSSLVGLRAHIASFAAGASSFSDLEFAVNYLAPVLRAPCQRRPRDAAARKRLQDGADCGPRIATIAIQLSDELECHEEDALDLVLAAGSAAELPEDPYFFPSSLQHLSRARRLACYRRYIALRCVEELLELRRSPALLPASAADVTALIDTHLVCVTAGARGVACRRPRVADSHTSCNS